MIFVSGANGKFAGAVIRNLLDDGLAGELVVGTRNVESPYALELVERGVTVRPADFGDARSMERAFDGVTRALLIPTYDTNDVRLQQNLQALAAAKRAGVRHVVYASFLRAELPEVEHSRLVHLPTEQAIRESGLDFTLLRHALYADILVGDLAETLATGVFRRSESSSRCAYIARADLGVSAALVLHTEGHAGRTYTETMERSYSGAEVAAAMSDVFGKPIRFEGIPVAEWPRYMIDHWGVPEPLAMSARGTMQVVADGAFDVVSPDYRTLTGRPARSLPEFLTSLREGVTR